MTAVGFNRTACVHKLYKGYNADHSQTRTQTTGNNTLAPRRLFYLNKPHTPRNHGSTPT